MLVQDVKKNMQIVFHDAPDFDKFKSTVPILLTSEFGSDGGGRYVQSISRIISHLALQVTAPDSSAKDQRSQR